MFENISTQKASATSRKCVSILNERLETAKDKANVELLIKKTSDLNIMKAAIAYNDKDIVDLCTKNFKSVHRAINLYDYLSTSARLNSYTHMLIKAIIFYFNKNKSKEAFTQEHLHAVLTSSETHASLELDQSTRNAIYSKGTSASQVSLTLAMFKALHIVNIERVNNKNVITLNKENALFKAMCDKLDYHLE